MIGQIKSDEYLQSEDIDDQDITGNKTASQPQDVAAKTIILPTTYDVFRKQVTDGNKFERQTRGFEIMKVNQR